MTDADGNSQGSQPIPARAVTCADDIYINDSMGLVYCPKTAPLPVSESIIKARGQRTKDDYKAVWTWTPKAPDPSVMMFFHGNHHYVTVDKFPAAGAPTAPQEDRKHKGKDKPKKLDGPKPPSRMPDWAANYEDAVNGVSEYPASGLYYKLDNLYGGQDKLPTAAGTIKEPVVLVPEDVELNTGKGDWAVPPLGQYDDGALGANEKFSETRLWKLADECYEHLRCRFTGSPGPYLTSTDPSGPSYLKNVKRLYVGGHSGGGKPMLEIAANLIRKGSPPTDLWLFDATYSWQFPKNYTAHFTAPNVPPKDDLSPYVTLCKQWKDSGTLGNGPQRNRFVCVYRPIHKERGRNLTLSQGPTSFMSV